MALILGLFGIYVLYGVDEYTPSEYVNMNFIYFGYAQAAWCLLLFFYASTKEPGIVTSRNIASLAKKYEYDGFLYDKKDCSTCKLAK
jgi:hypothetical protein